MAGTQLEASSAASQDSISRKLELEVEFELESNQSDIGSDIPSNSLLPAPRNSGSLMLIRCHLPIAMEVQ